MRSCLKPTKKGGASVRPGTSKRDFVDVTEQAKMRCRLGSCRYRLLNPRNTLQSLKANCRAYRKTAYTYTYHYATKHGRCAFVFPIPSEGRDDPPEDEPTETADDGQKDRKGEFLAGKGKGGDRPLMPPGSARWGGNPEKREYREERRVSDC